MDEKSLVEAIRIKIDKVLSKNRELVRELDESIERELQRKREEIELREEITELRRRVAVLEIAGATAGVSGMDDEGRRLANARINQMLREVDRCIAMMNN